MTPCLMSFILWAHRINLITLVDLHLIFEISSLRTEVLQATQAVKIKFEIDRKKHVGRSGDKLRAAIHVGQKQ